MVFNLVLTIVHVLGLMQRDYGATFWQMLFEDGLIFYMVAFTCNALPAVSLAFYEYRLSDADRHNLSRLLDPEYSQPEPYVSSVPCAFDRTDAFVTSDSCDECVSRNPLQRTTTYSLQFSCARNSIATVSTLIPFWLMQGVLP